MVKTLGGQVRFMQESAPCKSPPQARVRPKQESAPCKSPLHARVRPMQESAPCKSPPHARVRPMQESAPCKSPLQARVRPMYNVESTLCKSPTWQNRWTSNSHKPSLGSCDFPQILWACSVQPFLRFWTQTNKQTDLTSKINIFLEGEIEGLVKRAGGG